MHWWPERTRIRTLVNEKAPKACFSECNGHLIWQNMKQKLAFQIWEAIASVTSQMRLRKRNMFLKNQNFVLSNLQIKSLNLQNHNILWNTNLFLEGRKTSCMATFISWNHCDYLGV